jgi:hypothetical protein
MPSYYNLPPAKLPTELSAFEKILRTLPLEGAKEALDLLETLTRNVIQHPGEDKFRNVRTTNEKLAALFGCEGALDIMMHMGWKVEGEMVVLPKDVKLDFPNHIVKILEAKGHYSKAMSIKRGAAKLGRDPAKAGLLHQLELDRRERAPAAPEDTTAQSSGYTVSEAPVLADTPELDVPEVEESKGKKDTSSDVELSPESTTATEGIDSEPAQQDSTACGTVQQSTQPTPAASDDNPEVCSSSTQAVAATAAVAVAVPVAAQAVKPTSESERRAQDKDNRKDMTLQELRAMQKNKFNDFKADPSSAKSEAYNRPPATASGKEAGWFDWMWSGSSSSGSGGAPPPSDKPKPKMKTIADLPKPVRRGG